MESAFWPMVLSPLVSKATRHTDTRKHTCMLLIVFSDVRNIFIYQWITGQLLQQWKPKPNFSQRNSQQENIQETFPFHCTLRPRVLETFCMKINSFFQPQKSGILSPPCSVPVLLFSNAMLPVKLFHRKGDNLGGWFVHAPLCTSFQD